MADAETNINVIWSAASSSSQISHKTGSYSSLRLDRWFIKTNWFGLIVCRDKPDAKFFWLIKRERSYLSLLLEHGPPRHEN